MTTFSIASLFQTNMVLQQGKPIRLWGSAEDGARVQAVLGSGSQTLAQGETFANAGAWAITLPAQDSCSQTRLTITCCQENNEPETLLIDNVAIGEVWLASGQSNMEFFLKYDNDWEQTKNLPADPSIRMFNVPQIAFPGHSTRNNSHYGYWFDASAPALESFSAPGYSFALNLRKSTDVPIGIIGCNWGGTPARAWVSEDTLRSNGLESYITSADEEMQQFMNTAWPAASKEEKLQNLKETSIKAWAFEDSAAHCKEFEPMLYGADRTFQLKYMEEHANDPVIPMGPYHHFRPFGMYEMMLKTIIPYAAKGVLWYQGESDAGDIAYTYDRILTALIKSWRHEWDDEEMAFLLVQLAPFKEWLACDSNNYKIIRANQQKVADAVENVYISSIMDIGCTFNIHPRCKMEVGRRLALLAKGHIYENAEGNFDSPRINEAIFSGKDEITLFFDHVREFHRVDLNVRDHGTKVKEDYLADFLLRIELEENGAAALLTPKAQRIEKDKIILTFSHKLREKGRKYTLSMADADYAEINLQSEAGLCPLPFASVKVKEPWE